MKSCSRCGRLLLLAEFFRRKHGSADGRQSFCKDCDYVRRRQRPFKITPARYTPKQRMRVRLWRLVKRGAIPPARVLICIDCGAPAVHYDHYLGYTELTWAKVQPVCCRCHGLRARERGEFQRVGKAELSQK